MPSKLGKDFSDKAASNAAGNQGVLAHGLPIKMDHAVDHLAGTHFRIPSLNLFQTDAMGNERCDQIPYRFSIRKYRGMSSAG